MNIQSDYNYNISMQGKGPHTKVPDKSIRKFKDKVKQIFIDLIPEKTFSGEKAETDSYVNTNNILSRPHVNRIIMGTTALMTQPFIDLYNPNVDEETRKVSMYRTIAKIIAGTAVGTLVRGSCYKLVATMTDIEGTKKHSKSLLPKAWIEKFKKHPDYLGNYKSALATFMSLGIMLFTNFLLDAPLTLYLTNKFNESRQKQQKGKEVVNG